MAKSLSISVPILRRLVKSVSPKCPGRILLGTKVVQHSKVMTLTTPLQLCDIYKILRKHFGGIENKR
jgi:hypothetical protein